VDLDQGRRTLMAAKETYHVVTTDGDDHELRTLPAAWLLLTELNVAGRIDRVATEGMNEPGRVTVASRTPEDGWTLHPGAKGPRNEDFRASAHQAAHRRR
jgi:hypothetical protein